MKALALALLLALSTSFVCDDDDGSYSSGGGDGNEPEADEILDNGGLSDTLLKLIDLPEGWQAKNPDPPEGHPTRFVCLPTSVLTSIDAGASTSFLQLGHAMEPGNPPSISQAVAHYTRGSEAALNYVGIDGCLRYSGIADQVDDAVPLDLDGIGDEAFGLELEAEIEYQRQENDGPVVTGTVTFIYRAAYIRRGDVIAFVQSNDIELDEFMRLVEIVDERLQEAE
ncbi:MAG: hypothetical protein WEB00_12270 [Dehalococcoidia bacterium]